MKHVTLQLEASSHTDLLDKQPTLEEIIELQGKKKSAECLPMRQNVNGALTGTLSGLEDSDTPIVRFVEEGMEHVSPARSLVPLSSSDVGRGVLLIFERNDILRPIVAGMFQRGSTAAIAGRRIELLADGETLTITADKQVVLKCGDASITLTREGKVLIRGTYILNRSSGVNKIKGGSVQIN
jgi:Domain of unknown function (DUF6484)